MKIFILQLILCSLSMTLVSVLYCIISKILSNIQYARWRYYGWIVIGIGFLTPFKPCFGKPLIELDAEHISEQMVTSYTELSNMSSNSFKAARNADIPDMWQVIFSVWIIGVMLFLSYSLIRQLLFRRSVKRLSYAADIRTLQLTEQLCREMKIRRNVAVRSMAAVSTPMLTGIFRPCILLPEHDFSQEELRLVLKHELIHLKHGDLFMKLFLVFCHSVHWFNPFVLLLFRFAEQECEQACDENVMSDECTVSAGIYCRSILKTAENRLVPRFSSPSISTNFYSGKRSLQKRMKRILDNRKKYPMRVVCFLVCAATLATGTFAAYAETEQAVQFINDSLITIIDTPDNIDREVPAESEKDNTQEYAEATTTTVTEASVQADHSSETAAIPAYSEDNYYEPEFPAVTTLPYEEMQTVITSVTTVTNAESVTTDETTVTAAVTEEIPADTTTVPVTSDEEVQPSATSTTVTTARTTTESYVPDTSTLYTTTTKALPTYTATTTTATSLSMELPIYTTTTTSLKENETLTATTVFTTVTTTTTVPMATETTFTETTASATTVETTTASTTSYTVVTSAIDTTSLITTTLQNYTTTTTITTTVITYPADD